MSQGIKIARGRGAGFSWTPDGHCHGVLVEAVSGKCRVTAYWKADSGGKLAGVAEALSTARRSLGLGDTDYCVAGPAGGGWGMCDILMPSLKAEALQSALAFELRKLTPVPVERMTWGYRMLGHASDGKMHIRIFYARTDFWRKWLEMANGLAHLDMLAPAPVLLDPIFGDSTVTFTTDGVFSYTPGADGREIIPGGNAATLESMLPNEGLDIGSLSELDEEARRGFAEAICMALYAMGRELSKDVYTMPSIPSHLKPSRYLAVRFLSVCLLAVMLLFLGTGLVKALQQRIERLRLIKKDISAVDAQIKSLRNGVIANGDQAAKNLEAELTKYSFEVPELPDVLMEITDLVKPPAWMAGVFSWNADYATNVVQVTFKIREPAGDNTNVDLISRLNLSPILGDAIEVRGSSADMRLGGYVTRDITLKARYDTPEEKARFLKEEEERQRKEAEEKAALLNEQKQRKRTEANDKNVPDNDDMEVADEF